MLIIIDPGHGSPDPGAVGPTGLREADVVLDVARRLRALLIHDEYETVMTRTDDRFKSLEYRAHFANEEKAGVFVSIHANSFNDPVANGTEVWHYTGSKEGQRLAEITQRHLLRRLGRRDRGVKHNRSFYVLRHTTMPAVIAELAFISNPDEEALMRRGDFRTCAAVALFDSLREWMR